MKPNKFIKTILIILVFLALISIAHAIGISPAKKVVIFIPNKEETIVFNIVNNENRNIKVKIDADGPLENYIEIPNDTIAINGDERSKQLNLRLKLPETIEPGLHESKVIVREISYSNEEGTFISTMPLIKAKLQLRVPYPGKYIESKLIISESDRKVRFTMQVFNYGTESISDAKALIKIFENEKLIKQLETKSASIGKNSQALLDASWQAENIGSYYAVAEISYDSKKVELKEEFIVGTPFINVTRIIADNFKLGSIAKFDIYLKSNWNSKMENVYANALIYGESKTYLSSKTNQLVLLPEGEQPVNLFWDTEEADIGEYGLNLTVVSKLGENRHSIKLMVNKDSISTSLAPRRIAIKKYIIILIVAIIVLSIAAFLQRSMNQKVFK